MKCDQARAQLGDYQEGNLELARRRLVDDHLADCPACSTELGELRSTIALVRSLPTPELSPGFAEAVMQRIDAGETRVTRLPVPVRRILAPRIAAPIPRSRGVTPFMGWCDQDRRRSQPRPARIGSASDAR